MILSCSACSTRYLLDPDVLTSDGRRVRCTKCGHVWHQEPPGSSRVQAESAPAESRTIPRDSDLGQARHATAGGRNFLGWATLLLFVAGTIVIGFLARQQVVTAWPPIERLYMLVGLESEVIGTGLEIRNVTSERLLEEGIQSLVIKGEVMNTSEAVREVPNLSGRLQDSQGGTVHEWRFAATEARLLPGEIVIFETRVENPSFKAEALAISFIGHD